MFQSYEHKPEYSAYPIRGVAPVPTAKGNAVFLHTDVMWRYGEKQALTTFIGSRVEPKVPVDNYVRVPEGVSYPNYIEVDAPAALNSRDLELLRTATNRLGIDWRHMPRVGRHGCAIITIDKGAGAFEHSTYYNDEKLTYPLVPNSMFILAAVRALAIAGVMKHIAVQS